MFTPETLQRLRLLNRQPIADSSELPKLLSRLNAIPELSSRARDVQVAAKSGLIGDANPSLSELLERRLAQLHCQDIVTVDSDSDSNARETNPCELATHQVQDSTTSLSDGQEVETPWGPHWLVETDLAKLWPNAISATQSTREQWRATRQQWQPKSDEESPETRSVMPSPKSGKPTKTKKHQLDIRTLGDSFPDDVVFLDLETCGFAGTMVFLVGLVCPTANGPVLSQLFARNYAEEKAMFQTLWDLVGNHRTLVTFNGKSFDWPQVHDRSTMHLLGTRAEAEDVDSNVDPTSLVPMTPQTVRPEPYHIDLLHHARRHWKRRLPNCKLQTIERFVCGRHRSGDIPGRDIPVAYHEFVRSGDAWQIKTILHHNALDLVTLFQIALVMLRSEATECAT